MQKKPIAKAKLTESRAFETKPANTAVQTAQATTPNHEQIAKRAYEIYVGRGRIEGREREDWAQAERELFEHAHRRN